MAFKTLNEVFDGRLALPGDNGKIYRVPEPDAELGMWCTALYAAGLAMHIPEAPTPEHLPALQLDDAGEDAMYRRVLGPVFAELAEDGYGFSTQRFFAQTAFFWIAAGAEVAETFWNAGGSPKVEAPNRQERRHPPAPPAAKRATASMRNTAAASTTPQAGSMSGTKPRKARSAKPPARP